MARYEDHYSCVRETIRDIIEAQDEVANNNNDGCCTTSCEQSVQDLLTPPNNAGRNGFTTVPFMLYCNDGCTPFIPSGVYTENLPTNNGERSFLNCIQSPILRAKGFADDNENCVRVELLTGVNAANEVVQETGDTVCEFFVDETGERARNLMATGICLTLDPDCYCAIQCLDAVNPLPASMFGNGNGNNNGNGNTPV